MDFFEEATLRLKQQLKVSEDRQVAEFFGMTGKAWAARKRRDSFPEKELWALSAQRPDLNLDVDYILNGDKSLIEIIDKFLDYCGLSSAAPAALVGPGFGRLAATMLDAVVKRAEQVYG